MRGRPRGLSFHTPTLAVRQVVQFPGGKNGKAGAMKPGLGIRIPPSWCDDMKLQPGSLVLLDRRAGEMRMTVIDEKQLLESLRKVADEAER